jgi:hypothetical protein
LKKNVLKIARKVVATILAGATLVGIVAIFDPWIARVIAYDIISDEWAMVSFVVARIPFYVTIPVFWGFSFLKLFWVFYVEHADEPSETGIEARSQKLLYRGLYLLIQVAPDIGLILAGMVPAPLSNLLLVIFFVQVARGKMGRAHVVFLIFFGSMIRISMGVVGAGILGPEFFQQGFWSRIDLLFVHLLNYLSHR